MTVEGLANGDELHPLQAQFQENHALQCGFCTPGFLMTAYAFLRDKPQPTESDVRTGISGNICRCTGYAPIVQAIVKTGDGLTPGYQVSFWRCLRGNDNRRIVVGKFPG